MLHASHVYMYGFTDLCLSQQKLEEQLDTSAVRGPAEGTAGKSGLHSAAAGADAEVRILYCLHRLLVVTLHVSG
jgi:hypothetical protein